MTTTLQPGDRVQFRPDPPYAERPVNFVSGTVTELIQHGRMHYALIRRDDGSIDMIDVREVAPLSTEALMRAVRADPYDESDREEVIQSLKKAVQGGCRIRDVAEPGDYELMCRVGDLSGCELT